MLRRSSLGAAFGDLSVSTQRLPSGSVELLQRPPLPPRWMLFNDFVITETPAEDVQATYGGQKMPCMLYFTRVHAAASQLAALLCVCSV